MRALLTAVAMAALSTAAIAANDEYSAVEHRRIIDEFATCVVKNSARRVSDILLQQLNNVEIFRRHPGVIDSNCLPEGKSGDALEMRLPGPLMRYALADAMLRADRSIRVTNPSSIAALVHRQINEADYQPKPGKRFKPKEAEEKATERARDLAAVAMSRFGECVVRTHPGESGDLVRSEVGSQAESVAFKTLMPAFQHCVVQGERIVFSRDVLRGSVALNYFRLAHAPRQLQTPAGATE